MKTLAIYAALLLGASGAAMADDSGFYVSAGGGLSVPEDPSAFGITTHYDTGGVGAIAIGYDSDGIVRGEIEISLRGWSLDSVSGFGVSVPASGTGYTAAETINLYLDIPTDSDWTPYLGIGFGGGVTWVENAAIAGIPIAGDESFSFVYQGIAGVAYRLSDRLSITGEYRYFGTDDITFVDNHSAMIGFRYSFF